MYELWTIRPANLVMEFRTASEAKKVIDEFTEDNGFDALENMVLFSGVSANHHGDFVAQDTAIAMEVSQLATVEKFIEQLRPSGPALARESELIEQLLNRIDSTLLSESATNVEWLNGFLAAALHNVRIDIAKGELEIGKPLDTPVFESKTLTPTG